MSKTVRSRRGWIIVMALLSFMSGWALVFIAPVYGETQYQLKKFNPQVVSEPGCPVEIVGAGTELEIDPFGTPVAARHYIDYRNAGNRPVMAVKFRIGYIRPDGTPYIPMTDGDDEQVVQPGQQASGKWRGGCDPKTVAVKMRVLKVRFTDGNVWTSAKITDPQSQQQGFAPLTTESPAMFGQAAVPQGQPVPLSNYGQQGFRGYPDRTTSGSVPLNNQAPGSGNNGALYPSGPNAGDFPTMAPTGQYAGGPPPGQAAVAAPPQDAPGLDSLIPTGGPVSASGQSAPPPSMDSGTPSVSSFAPTVAPQATAPPPASAKPQPPMDPLDMIDSILHTGKKPAPAAVAPSNNPITPDSQKPSGSGQSGDKPPQLR